MRSAPLLSIAAMGSNAGHVARVAGSQKRTVGRSARAQEADRTCGINKAALAA